MEWRSHIQSIKKTGKMKNNIGWHVLHVKFNNEKKAHNDLKRLGVESFLPMGLTIRQWSDRKKKIYTPLFPSYVFVNIKSKLDFHTALSVDSVRSYIRFGDEYGRVSEKEIKQMKILTEDKEITEVETNVKLPKIGDKLKIEKGKLSGVECEVYRINENHKINVWINSLHQNISATVPLHYFQGGGAGLIQH
ncbi:NusG antitermination factor [Tenacibaculum halocynthiae]